jgi:hypothetical protein
MVEAPGSSKVNGGRGESKVAPVTRGSVPLSGSEVKAEVAEATCAVSPPPPPAATAKLEKEEAEPAAAAGRADAGTEAAGVRASTAATVDKATAEQEKEETGSTAVEAAPLETGEAARRYPTRAKNYVKLKREDREDGLRGGRGLTLVRFPAQRKRFLWDRGCMQGLFVGVWVVLGVGRGSLWCSLRQKRLGLS